MKLLKQETQQPADCAHESKTETHNSVLKRIHLYHTHTKLTSTELRLLWDPEVLTIQWTYTLSGPSTLMSARCCCSAEHTNTAEGPH